MYTIVVKIKGLRSAACVSSIEYKLQQLPKMEAVHVDFVTSEALLRSFEKINIEEVKAIIEENGFAMEVLEKPTIQRRERTPKDNTVFYSGLIFFVLLISAPSPLSSYFYSSPKAKRHSTKRNDFIKSL